MYDPLYMLKQCVIYTVCKEYFGENPIYSKKLIGIEPKIVEERDGKMNFSTRTEKMIYVLHG